MESMRAGLTCSNLSPDVDVIRHTDTKLSSIRISVYQVRADLGSTALQPFHWVPQTGPYQFPVALNSGCCHLQGQIPVAIAASALGWAAGQTPLQLLHLIELHTRSIR